MRGTTGAIIKRMASEGRGNAIYTTVQLEAAPPSLLLRVFSLSDMSGVLE